MSRKHDHSAPRRTNVPTLTSLEDRRLMTRGLASMPMPMPHAVQTTAAAVAVTDAKLADGAAGFATLAGGGAGFATASTLPAFDAASSKDWVYMGSDAQFGPSTSYVVYGGGNAWPAPTFSPGGTADASTPQGKLDAAFAKQSADIQAVQDKSEVTPRLLAALRTAREKVASQAGDADAALVKTLQDGTQAVLQSGTFTDAQQAQLKADYTAALKGAGVSDAAVADLFAAQDAVRAASGVTTADLTTLADDQAAVQALLDAMPKDDLAYAKGDLAVASGTAGGAVTTVALTPFTTATTNSATTTATTTAAAPGASSASHASAIATAMGVAPVGARTGSPNEGVVPTASLTSLNVRPSGFDASVQATRLSGMTRRMTGSNVVLPKNVATTKGPTRAFVVNARAVPSASRRAAPFRAMRVTSQGFDS